jgi:hypothetical protein
MVIAPPAGGLPNSQSVVIRNYLHHPIRHRAFFCSLQAVEDSVNCLTGSIGSNVATLIASLFEGMFLMDIAIFVTHLQSNSQKSFEFAALVGGV